MPTVAETVNRYAELLARGGADELASLYTPDATVEDPVGSGVRHGHDEIRELYNGIEKQNRTVDLLSVHINGSEAAFLARLTIITGDVQTRIDGIDVMTFDDDGCITSMRAFWSVPDQVAAFYAENRGRTAPRLKITTDAWLLACGQRFWRCISSGRPGN
jgi:steroid delta-isomerase